MGLTDAVGYTAVRVVDRAESDQGVTEDTAGSQRVRREDEGGAWGHSANQTRVWKRSWPTNRARLLPS